MPRTEVHFYQDDDGSVPVRDWLAELQQNSPAAFVKCVTVIERLAQFGYELRRPHTDMLRDGIFELRVRHLRVNYRILYFFHGQNVVVLAHGLTKEKEVLDIDIERALKRKRNLVGDPDKYTFEGDDDG